MIRIVQLGAAQRRGEGLAYRDRPQRPQPGACCAKGRHRWLELLRRPIRQRLAQKGTLGRFPPQTLHPVRRPRWDEADRSRQGLGPNGRSLPSGKLSDSAGTADEVRRHRSILQQFPEDRRRYSRNTQNRQVWRI